MLRSAHKNSWLSLILNDTCTSRNVWFCKDRNNLGNCHFTFTWILFIQSFSCGEAQKFMQKCMPYSVIWLISKVKTGHFFVSLKIEMAKSIQRIIRLNLYTIFFTLVFLIIFPTCLIFFIPIYILRFIVTILRKMFRPDLGKLVQTRSAVIAATDDPYKDPNWILCVWLVLDGKLDFEQFRVNFYNNIVLKKTRAGHLHSPEYQQYFSKWLGFLFWKWEEKFDIKDHMRYVFPDDIDATVNEEELRQLIKQLAWKPFKSKKSPWEFLFVPNYRENGKDVPDKSVLFLRVHHGFCDGFSILHLLMKEVNNISLVNVAKPARAQKSFVIKMFQTILFWITCPYLFMKMLVRTVDTNEWHLPSQKLIRPLNTGFTERIPLTYIKEIKNIHRVSFSAVIYASLTGALRNMMLEMGKTVPSYMSTAVAVPMPGHPEKLRNHFIFSFLQLPIGIEDPIDRLHKVERNLTQLKRSPVPLFNFGLIPILGGSFASTMKLFSANKYSTVLTSNFPGPPATTYFIGGGGSNRVTDMNFAAGLGEGDVGIGFCMMSYDEAMRIITSFDTNILSSDAMVDLFNKKIMEEMETFRLSANSV